MPQVHTTITTPTVEGVTRQTILKRFLDRTGFGLYGTIDSGNTTTLVDDLLIGQGNHVKSFVGGFVRIVQADAAAPEGEIKPISAFDPATGTPTFAAVSATVAAGDEYELWKPVMHPQRVLNWLDELLTENIELPAWAMLTEVADGDMEQSHTTDWTGTNATITKVATDAPYGKRALNVAATSASGYASSNSLYVEPGKKYHVSALARNVDSASLQLQVRDITNGADVESTSYSGKYWARVVCEFVAPAGCYEVKLRLVTVTNGAGARWDEVCFYPVNTAEMPLPWWVRKAGQVWRVFKLAPIQEATDIWDSSLRGDHAPDWEPQDPFRVGARLRVVNRHAGLTAPLYIAGGRNETAYANDYTEVKYVNPDLILACLLYKSYEHLSSQLVTGQQDTLAFIQKSRFWQATYKALKYEDNLKIQQYLTGKKHESAYLDDRFAFRV